MIVFIELYMIECLFKNGGMVSRRLFLLYKKLMFVGLYIWSMIIILNYKFVIRFIMYFRKKKKGK